MKNKNSSKKEQRLEVYRNHGYFIEDFDGKNYTISMPISRSDSQIEK